VTPLWSADGIGVELAVRRVDIYFTWSNDGYANASGTLMAATFVSSIAALIKSKIYP
jgi:subtilisin family serine protease